MSADVCSLPCLLCSLSLPLSTVARFQRRYDPLNLSRLQYMIDTGRLDASRPIKMDTLFWSGAVGRFKHGVALLGDVRKEGGGGRKKRRGRKIDMGWVHIIKSDYIILTLPPVNKNLFSRML